uniref:DNA mismatch repair proteins mutS family domain-containing protein n=1 Tax=Ciona savignyi TaxID=51511 RepID=H2YI01_CIOSA
QSSGHRSTPKSTPRSRSTPKVSDTPRSNDPSNIVTIVEGRGLARGEIGMASIDLKNPVLTLSQFSDSQTYVKTMTKLQILSPIEIVFPSTMCDNGNMAQVFKFVNDNFQNSNITTVQRHYFNEGNGLDMIKRLVMKENSSVIMDVTSKYYCLAASAALIKYVEFVQNTIYASESLRILFKGSEQTTLIDAGTSTVLELTTNLTYEPQVRKSDHSLFGMLNRTKTQGGGRLLRSNILQPPNDVETIQGRLDIVEELSNSSEIFFGMQSVLARFEIDIDHLLSSLVQIPKQETDKTREHHMTTAILLKHVTELVPALCETLSEGKCELFQAYKTSLQDARYGCINDMISRTMHVDARYTKGHLSMKTQRCFAVKQGLHGVLDLSRVTYTELIEDINQLISQQAEKHGLPLKSAYTVSRGFHIQVATKSVQDLPEEFIKVSKTKSTYSFTTEDLIRLNNKVEISIKDINLLSDALIADLLVEVRTCIGCLYNLSEIVSTLDMLMSFAHVRTITDCVRPEFTDTLAIKNGRHPVLDRILPEVVPNNVYAADGTNFSIITGPNMSGKSTYLKMIALLQIVAQIGCFVPAEFASFRIADQIFSRIGSDDDMETNSSTFVLEMKEINYILQNCRANSLIIIDELGRGTSSEEGVGLCWAISEFLLVQKSFTFFATHFLELCRLESIYPNVENYHLKIQHIMTTRGSLRKVSYTYVLTKGHTEEKHYGLQLAELFNFPSIMMSQAREIATRIQERSDASDAVTTAERKRDNADYRFATKLLQAARSSKLSSDALKDYL